MARRKRVEEHINHDRWLISYADFITLLFAFFVVMYSISSVNEGKYRVLSDTLESVFSNPKKSLDPIQIGEISRSPNNDDEDNEENSVVGPEIEIPNDEDINSVNSVVDSEN